MAKMYFEINLDDDTERKFRLKAMQRYDGKKGALSWTIKDLIEEWLKKEKKP